MFTLFFYLWWDWHIVVGSNIVAHNNVWRKGRHCFVPTNGGEVNYLTNTWLNNSYTMGMVSRYMVASQDPHMEVVKRNFKYLQGTIDFDLMFILIREIKLEGFVNASWARHWNNKGSTIRYMFQLYELTITWPTK